MPTTTKNYSPSISGSFSKSIQQLSAKRAVSLNGKTHVIDIFDITSSILASDQFTFSGKFYQTEATEFVALASRWETNKAQWGLSIQETGSLAIHFATSGGIIQSSSFGRSAQGLIKTGSFYTIAIAYSGNGSTNDDKCKLYLDGEAISLGFSGTIPPFLITSSNSILRIGHFPILGNTTFNGRMCELIYYSKTLSDNEIRNIHYDFYDYPNKIFHFPCNEDSGSIVLSRNNTFKGHLSGVITEGFVLRDWVGGSNTDGQQIKIMPWGDSNTEGSNQPRMVGAYRIELHQRLVNQGIKFKFVGGRRNGPAHLNDKAHEGLSGCTLTAMLLTASATMSGHFSTTDNGIVILNCGSNDIVGGASGSQTADRLDSVVSEVLSIRPNLKLLLCSNLPRSGIATQLGIYNTEIKTTVVPKWKNLGYSVEYCDASSSVFFNSDMSDGTHLEIYGYAMEGKRIFNRLVEIKWI